MSDMAIANSTSTVMHIQAAAAVGSSQSYTVTRDTF